MGNLKLKTSRRDSLFYIVIYSLRFNESYTTHKAPHDTFSTDIATNDTTQISVTFSFDGFPLLKDSKGVIEEFIKLVSDLYIADTYDGTIGSVTKATKTSKRDSAV